MSNKEKILGVIYPIPAELASQMFKLNRNVFVKFIPREPTKKTKIRISKGMKFYFYKSGADKCVVGEAKIVLIEYLIPKEAINKYDQNLITPEEELAVYSKGREQKKLQVLVLKSIKEYKSPLKMVKSITMAGQYVTSDNIKKLFL